MPASDLVNLSGLMDDAKCFALVRQHRWPEGVCCPGCDSSSVIRDGCDDTQPHRQRYRCKACAGRFDDLMRRGLVAKMPAVELKGKVEIDEVYVVAGHKGQPDEVAKRGGLDGAASWQARRDGARWRRTSHRSLA